MEDLKENKIIVRYKFPTLQNNERSYVIMDLVCKDIKEANRYIDLRKSRFPDVHIVSSDE